ncbi:MAG TPA: peptidylprolyl isomerase, partial [Chitinophagaceae bacterium]|nr:peptidylprolyl isomerase [Chitinophagaceae bacterium]
NLPPHPECSFMEGQLIQKALVIQAGKDSIPLSDDELDALLDNQIRAFILQYGSQQELELVAGKSVYQIKEDLRQPFKERKLADEMREKILSNVKITPTEVKDFFEKIPKDSLPYLESQLEINQIILYPKPNKDVEEYSINQLNEWKKQVESGKQKFDVLAKLYSMDPGSKDQGGQYSVNRNDKQWDPTWFAAIWKLKEGQISPVIKSKFGLHIIQMVSRAGDDAIVRHILLLPSVTATEIKAATEKLDSVRNQIIAGNLNFGAAVNKYSEDDNSKNNGGQIMGSDGSTMLTIDQLDKDLVLALKNMSPGDISKPIAYKDDRQRDAVRIIYLRTRTAPHVQNLKDDYNAIAQEALEHKKADVMQKWFKAHINTYYIDIDKSFNSCPNIAPWIAAENNESSVAN